MKPIIGIPCGTLHDRDWCPPIHGHRQTYVDAVVRAGGVPLFMPLIEDESIMRIMFDRIDGLLLAGGGDIVPTYYGEEPLPELGTVDPVRDAVEMPLVRWAIAEHKPVLGICRGMQLLNVSLGGSLYQDIPSQLQSDIVHDISYSQKDWTYMAHELRLDPSSRLATILGLTSFSTNSLHHQALKDIAPHLRPVAWAPDGVIEAIEGRNGQFMMGVQCHPEALQGEADPRWRPLFEHFIEQCRVSMIAPA